MDRACLDLQRVLLRQGRSQRLPSGHAPERLYPTQRAAAPLRRNDRHGDAARGADGPLRGRADPSRLAPALRERAGRRRGARRRRGGRRAGTRTAGADHRPARRGRALRARRRSPPAISGAKAITVNVSDIAAMAASPRVRARRDGVAERRRGRVGDGALRGHARRVRASTRSRSSAGTPTGRTSSSCRSPWSGEVAPGRAVTSLGGALGDRIVVTGSLGAAAGGLALSRAAAGQGCRRALAAVGPRADRGPRAAGRARRRGAGRSRTPGRPR